MSFYMVMWNQNIAKKQCFIVYIKTDDIYKDIAVDVETRFDTSYYKLDRPLPEEKNLKSSWINET